MTKRLPAAQRVYEILLKAYPAKFRESYGSQMAQLFRDCQRQQGAQDRPALALKFWWQMVSDILATAPKERLETFAKGESLMRIVRNLVIAVVVYVIAFMLTGTLLVQARPHLPLAVGSFFDALVSIGILFNFIVLILVTTHLMSAARAVVTSAAATAVLITVILALITMRVPVESRPKLISVFMLILSLGIWFGIHWVWAQRRQAPRQVT